jgi:hypothetical protein
MLIHEFAEASSGRFNPQWPVQFWLRKDENDDNAPYILQFVYRDRLFRIGAENYGDWYDVVAVSRIINFALETAGQPERFIALHSDGQFAKFVFADPAVFVPLADKYSLPLSKDPSQAMRKGIEFERQAIESLK